MSTDSPADRVKRGIEQITEGLRTLSTGPFDYYLKSLVAGDKLIRERFSPFKVGETVELAVAPKCNNGWSGCAHFLIEGAPGVVQEIEVTAEAVLRYMIVFERETFIYEGVERPVMHKHAFCFCENELRASNRKLNL